MFTKVILSLSLLPFALCNPSSDTPTLSRQSSFSSEAEKKAKFAELNSYWPSITTKLHDSFSYQQTLAIGHIGENIDDIIAVLRPVYLQYYRLHKGVRSDVVALWDLCNKILEGVTEKGKISEKVQGEIERLSDVANKVLEGLEGEKLKVVKGLKKALSDGKMVRKVVEELEQYKKYEKSAGFVKEKLVANGVENDGERVESDE